MTNDLSRKLEYRSYSLAYNLSLSPLSLANIFENFSDEEIVNFESNCGVVYQLLKKHPELLNTVDSERIEFFFEELIEEFKINVSITSVVAEVVEKFNIYYMPQYIHYIVKLIDIAIVSMRKQGFEITPYSITDIDIIGMVYRLTQRLKVSTFEECTDSIDTLITKNNFNYLIREMSVLQDRKSSTVFEEMIFIIKRIIEKVESMEIEEIDYSSEDYNPLEEYYIPKDDMIKLCYRSIDIDIRSFNEEDMQYFISVISSIMEVNKGDDKIYKICMKIMESLFKYLKSEITELLDNNIPADRIVMGIIKNGYIEYRLSRVLYITSKDFIVNTYLQNPILIREYFILRDLKNIEHLYSSWYNSKSTDSGDALYEPYLNIDLDKVKQLLPMTDDEIENIIIYPLENI